MKPRQRQDEGCRGFKVHVLSLAAGAAIASGALAQAPEPAPAAPPSPAANHAEGGLQRVEVTASKRKQLQSELAGTVTAINGITLEALGAVDAEDIFKLSPGVQFNKGNADGAMYSIRGIGVNTVSDNVIFGQASTGLYIEDIPFTDPYVYISTPDVAPFDLERVEVLRGPQGALYGSSSLGGAVRYLYAKPDLKTQHFSLLAGASKVAEGGTGYTTSAMANLPLAQGTAGLRVVLGKRRDPGYVDNVGTGRDDVNSIDADQARILLGLKPIDGLDITAIYARGTSGQNGSSGISPDAGELKSNAPTDASMDSVYDLGTLQVNWEVGGLRLTSLTGYQTKKRNQNGDLSYAMVPDFTLNDIVDADGNVVPYPQVDRALNFERRRSNAFSQELRLTPDSEGTTFNWLAGAFYQRTNFFRTQTVTWPGANDPVNLPDDIYFDTLRRGTASERSLFADLEWKATPQWTFGLGARYFETEVEFERSNYGAPFTTFEASESGTTPKLSARWQFTPTAAAYVSASRGYRYGGINTVGSIPYKSDSLWNYEAGLRLRPGRTLALDLTAFVLDWRDVQISTANEAGFVIINNVDKARSTGIEATLGWRPSADWRVNGSVALTDAEIGTAFTSAAGRPVAGGTSLPGVARFQATLDTSYAFAGPFESSGTASAVLQHVGSRRAQLDADLRLKAYTTLDLRLAMAWERFEVAAYVQNATDSRGQSSAFVNYASYIDPGAINYQEWTLVRPRTIGVSFRYDY